MNKITLTIPKIAVVTLLALGTILPTPAHALFGVTPQPVIEVGPSAGFISATAAHTAVTAIDTTALNVKENVLDSVAYALKQGVIAAVTQSIVNWINNGFEGGPSFVTNLRGFLGEIADQTSLDFIQGSQLDFLCSPFQLEIRIALAVQRQPFKERIRCSLGDVIDNADAFFSGDFSQGGWPAWFRVFGSRQNNPYGSYALASAQLSAEIAGRQSEEVTLLGFGNGFFSKKVCRPGSEVLTTVDTTDPNAEPESVCLDYDIVTPGAQINASLAKWLNIGADQLALADEINEIVNALIAQLAQQALTSIDGLTGLSSRSSSSARDITRTGSGATERASYLESLVNETTENTLVVGGNALVRDIEVAIDLEEEYQDVVEELVEGLEDVTLQYEGIYSCYVNIVQNPSSFTTISGLTAQDRANTASTTLASSVTPRLSSFEKELTLSSETLQKLIVLRAEASRARNTDELNAAANKYDVLLASNVIHSADDIATARIDLAAQNETIEVLEDELRNARRECTRL